MKIVLPVLLCAILLMTSGVSGAQELFLRKSPAPEGSSDPASGEKPKAVPLFLPTAPSSSSSARAPGQPLFLDAPPVQAKYQQAPSKVYSLLKQKDVTELTPAEQNELGLESTRLANLASMRQETARLQEQTMQALAKWEADSAAESARQAALEAQKNAAAAQAAKPVNPQQQPARRAVPYAPKTEDAVTPPRVFNTVR